jgi:hypothetical protein
MKKITFNKAKELIKISNYLKIDEIVCTNKDAINLCYKHLGNLYYDENAEIISDKENTFEIELFKL